MNFDLQHFGVSFSDQVLLCLSWPKNFHSFSSFKIIFVDLICLFVCDVTTTYNKKWRRKRINRDEIPNVFACKCYVSCVVPSAKDLFEAGVLFFVGGIFLSHFSFHFHSFSC